VADEALHTSLGHDNAKAAWIEAYRRGLEVNY
jgi:hypothetical protein